MLTILFCGIVLRLCGLPFPGGRRPARLQWPRALRLRVAAGKTGGDQ
jgi:hypothetical protein